MACHLKAPQKTSTFGFQSSLHDDSFLKSLDLDPNVFLSHPSLFEEYDNSVAPYLPMLSSKSDTNSEEGSSDSDDDVDPYNFHSVHPVFTPPDDFATHSTAVHCQDTPYIPGDRYDDFDGDLMLPLDEPTVENEPHTVQCPSPVRVDASKLPETPSILSPSIADMVAFHSLHSLSPATTPSETTEASSTDPGSDVDAEGDSDYDPTDSEDGHDDEDEYIPDLQFPASKKRRAFTQLDRPTSEIPSASSSASPASSSSFSRASSVTSNSSKRSRVSPGSRNIQATPDGPVRLVNRADPWACPVEGCCWIQRNRRSPDLKRHIKTHSRLSDPADWVCCGIPVDIAHYYERDVRTEKTYMFKDKHMIGGCMKTFARRDALKRHLDNPNIKCVGNLHRYFD